MALGSATIVLTTRCNLHCRYCCVRRRDRPVIAWPLLRRSLDRVLELASESLEVSFTGGEPLLAFPVLRRAVAHVERNRPGDRPARFKLLTNGLLLDRRTLSYLDRHDFALQLSFDGVVPSQAARGPSTFEPLDRLLTTIREEFPRIWSSRLTVSLTLSPAAVPRFAASVEYFLARRVAALSAVPVMGRGRWHLEDITELDRQFELASAASRKYYEATGDVPIESFRRSSSAARPARSEWQCGAAEGTAVTVDVDGGAYGCLLACSSYQGQTCAAMRPTVSALAAGPVLSPDLPARLSGMKDVARAAGVLLHPEKRYSGYRRCAECEFLGRCKPCPLGPSLAPTWDDPLRVPNFVCAFSQVSSRHRDRFPAQPTIRDLLKGYGQKAEEQGRGS